MFPGLPNTSEGICIDQSTVNQVVYLSGSLATQMFTGRRSKSTNWLAESQSGAWW
jgi:hypothetical protein